MDSNSNSNSSSGSSSSSSSADLTFDKVFDELLDATFRNPFIPSDMNYRILDFTFCPILPIDFITLIIKMELCTLQAIHNLDLNSQSNEFKTAKALFDYIYSQPFQSTMYVFTKEQLTLLENLLQRFAYVLRAESFFCEDMYTPRLQKKRSDLLLSEESRLSALLRYINTIK
jgi:hypothetical protein